MDKHRKTMLRAYAAFNDRSLEAHGTEEAQDAKRRANRIAEDLGEFTAADWAIVDAATRSYIAESTP